MLFYFKKYKEFIEILISSVLMSLLIYSENLLSNINFFNVVYALLAFVIILELVRMVGEYILTHHISIRLVIDTFIIFMLREVILIYSDKSMDLYIKGFYIFTGFTIVYLLFNLRKKAIDCSPVS